MAEHEFYASSGVSALRDLIDGAENGDTVTVVADWSDAIGNPPDIAEQRADYAEGVVSVATDLERAAKDLGKVGEGQEKSLNYKIVDTNRFPIQRR